MTYLQGIDYGPRKGTLGWQVHMAEGGDGTARWLARRVGESDSAWRERVNGVSSNFVILSTGEAVQMLGWGRASGNINPRDRSTDKAFYGRRYLLDVLGDHWRDPNAYTISVELCGFREKGPTRAQVETLIGLIEESKALFPGIRGAFGHADQTDTKGCPGTAPLMREFWERVGHGLFRPKETPPDMALQVPAGDYRIELPAGTPFYSDGALRERLGTLSKAASVAYCGATIGSPSRAILVSTGAPYADKEPRLTQVYIREDAGDPVAVPPADPHPAPTVTYRLEIDGQPVAEGSRTL